MLLVDPRDYGAVGDGVADDTDALIHALGALPAEGGILFLDDGLTFRTTDRIKIPGDHIKLWSPNGQSEIFAETGGEDRAQAFVCEDLDGCGFFGLHFRSDATRRLSALEDSQIAIDGGTLAEVVGVEIEGSASAAVFFFGESEHSFVEGNYIHHSWSDAVHFTNGSQQAWVWDNTIYNGGSGGGDDGVACVSYEDEPVCGHMEWWNNSHFGDGWGRGFSVIGGEQIEIHDNFARDIGAAGIIVASEPTYDTPGSRDISIHDNVLYRTSQIVPHPGILVSGLSGLIAGITIENNLVVESASGEAFRREGDTDDVEERATLTSSLLLPDPLPTIDDRPALRDTSILKTRDLSFAPPEARRGLYRVHIRRSPRGIGFEQRFEYVVAGPTEIVKQWSTEIDAEIVACSSGDNEEFALIYTSSAVVVPDSLRAVDFAELRSGDRDGSLSALWAGLEPLG